MEDINPTKVIQQRLVMALELDKYSFIVNAVKKVDVSSDKLFQRTFNGYYMIRRNSEWRAIYYDLFEKVKHSDHITFEFILDELFELTDNIEASFSSKMLATLKPEMPIWDKFVLQNLAIKAPSPNDPDRLQKTVELYQGIVGWYDSFLTTVNAKECLTKFDEIFPDYSWFSDVKKIDFYLWSIR